MVTIIKYNNSTIYHAIYIKVFSAGAVSNLRVSTDDVINATTNGTAFPELIIVFEEAFEIKYKKDLS